MANRIKETLPSIIITGTYAVKKREFKDKKFHRVTIEAGVALVGEEAFANCGIRVLFIAKDVQIIQKDAFINNNIESLTIPSGVKMLGENAFANCGIKNLIITKYLYERYKDSFAGNDITLNSIKFID